MKTLSLTSLSSIRCDIPAQKDRSSLANSQVRKGGLPPLERQRRDWLLQPSSSSPPVKPEVFHLEKKCFHLEGSFVFRGDNTQSRRWRSSGGKPPFLTCKLPYALLRFHTVAT